MSLVNALLIAIWAGYCSFDDQGPQMFRRPLLVGPVVGLILGDLPTALVISATLELMWMGLGNMAGYQTPDMIVGTIIGVTVLIQQLIVVTRVLKQFFEPWAQRLADNGDLSGIMQINIVAFLIQFSIRAIPTFLFVYFQKGIIDKILAVVPSNILNGLGTASSLLPAVGLSILMTMMMKGTLWPFLIFGFVLSAYLNLGILPVTLISLIFAVIYSYIMEIIDKQNEMGSENSSSNNQQVDEDTGYDL